jgi:hypothetical protein
MTTIDKYNNNLNNDKNIYPHAMFEKYGTALCGVGVRAPVFAGLTSLHRDKKSYFKYYPLCVKDGRSQNYNSNYVGAHTGEYMRCQR